MNKGFYILTKDILVDIICIRLLDVVSFFRLSRSSKTLYNLLEKHLPRKEAIKHFGWEFKTKKMDISWKHARERHESGNWCVGGCGKRSRVKNKTNFCQAYGMSRTLKPPLRICDLCSIKRQGNSHWYFGRDDDIRVLKDAKDLYYTFKRQKRDVFPELVTFIRNEIENVRRIKAKVGDTLVPIYYVDEDDIILEITRIDHYEMFVYEEEHLKMRYFVNYPGYPYSYVDADTGLLDVFEHEFGCGHPTDIRYVLKK